MKLPDFLVIGGMKCGTTTLYRDLLTNPAIHIPEKELNFLSRRKALRPTAREDYAACFSDADQGQCCGDISTEYSMLPDISDVARRAGALLPATTRIVYLVRDPVRRAISHHFHMHCWHGEGHMAADINACVQQHAGIIAYGRYMLQLRPWLETFGEDAMHVIVLEEYVRDRKAVIAKLSDFLGIPAQLERVRDDVIYNRGDNKPVLRGVWSRIHDSALYRRWIRPTISPAVKERLSRILLPKAPPRPAPPTLATVDKIIDGVANDAAQLQRWLGRDKPLWDFDAIRAEFRANALPQAA